MSLTPEQRKAFEAAKLRASILLTDTESNHVQEMTDIPRSLGMSWVRADFARSLERRLAEAEQQRNAAVSRVDALEGALTQCLSWTECLREHIQSKSVFDEIERDIATARAALSTPSVESPYLVAMREYFEARDKLRNYINTAPHFRQGEPEHKRLYDDTVTTEQRCRALIAQTDGNKQKK